MPVAVAVLVMVIQIQAELEERKLNVPMALEMLVAAIPEMNYKTFCFHTLRLQIA